MIGKTIFPVLVDGVAAKAGRLSKRPEGMYLSSGFKLADFGHPL